MFSKYTTYGTHFQLAISLVVYGINYVDFSRVDLFSLPRLTFASTTIYLGPDKFVWPLPMVKFCPSCSILAAEDGIIVSFGRRVLFVMR